MHINKFYAYSIVLIVPKKDFNHHCHLFSTPEIHQSGYRTCH